jgi:hypothetical protein
VVTSVSVFTNYFPSNIRKKQTLQTSIWLQQEVCFISLVARIIIIIMSGHSYHDQQQHKTRKNMLKIIIITTAIGAVAAIGAFLFDALWLFGW